MKVTILIAAALLSTLLGVAVLDASAQDQVAIPMTEEHIARIRSNCVDAQSVLFQIHASDAGLRVNRGQIYESMSTKLMTPFNSRMVLNRIDTTNLLSISNEYEKQLKEFRAQYKTYEEAMSDTLAIDCVNQPVAFYDHVTETRKQRQLTHESTAALHETIRQYGSEVKAFVETFQADKS